MKTNISAYQSVIKDLKKNYQKCKKYSSIYCQSCLMHTFIIPVLERELALLEIDADSTYYKTENS